VAVGEVPGGTWTLGGIDLNQAELFAQDSAENITVYYTPVLEETYYVVGLEDLLVDNTSVREAQSSYGLTVVDSGTTFFIVTTQIYQAIKEVFQQNYCFLPNICGPNSILTFVCL
jgi:hypothetical protein